MFKRVAHSPALLINADAGGQPYFANGLEGETQDHGEAALEVTVFRVVVGDVQTKDKALVFILDADGRTDRSAARPKIFAVGAVEGPVF